MITNLRKSSRAACCCLFHLHTHLLALFELLTHLHSKCARDLPQHPHQASQILEPESAQLTALQESDTQVSKSLPLSPSVSVSPACSRVWHSEIEVLERRDCASQLQQSSIMLLHRYRALEKKLKFFTIKPRISLVRFTDPPAPGRKHISCSSCFILLSFSLQLRERSLIHFESRFPSATTSSSPPTPILVVAVCCCCYLCS